MWWNVSHVVKVFQSGARRPRGVTLFNYIQVTKPVRLQDYLHAVICFNMVTFAEKIRT